MRYLTSMIKELSIGRQRDSLPLSLSMDESQYEQILKTGKTLLVMITVEEGDTFDDVKESAQRIRGIFQSVRNEVNAVTLLPFGHLSEFASNDNQYTEMLVDKFSRTLNNAGINTHVIPPSAANVFIAHIMLFDKFSTVRMGTTTASLKRTLMSLMRGIGKEKFFRVLSDMFTLDKEKES